HPTTSSSSMLPPPPRSTLFPYTTLFRSEIGSPDLAKVADLHRDALKADVFIGSDGPRLSTSRPTIFLGCRGGIRLHLDVNLREGDRKSTRLNSSHSQISYAVFCLKKKKN